MGDAASAEARRHSLMQLYTEHLFGTALSKAPTKVEFWFSSEASADASNEFAAKRRLYFFVLQDQQTRLTLAVRELEVVEEAANEVSSDAFSNLNSLAHKLFAMVCTETP